MRFFMAYKWIISIVLFFIVYIIYSYIGNIASFRYGEKEIYIRSIDGKFILTTTSWPRKSENYLVLVDDGGVFGGMTVYVNLCDSSYHVIAIGGFVEVGKVEFSYETMYWYEHGKKRRILEKEYSNSECKFIFSY